MEDFAMAFSSFENLNQLILNIYDRNLPVHTRISNFFRDIAPFIYFDRASIMIFYKDEVGDYRKQTSFTINWNKPLLRKYDAHYCKLDDTLAPLDRPEPTIIKSSSFFNEALRMQTEYWQGYLAPNNADYEITANLQLSMDKKYRANLSFTRGKEAGDFNDYHMRLTRLFQPHLSRMVKEYISTSYDEDSLYGTGEYNCVGYCILDDNCQVVKRNGIFDRLNTSINNQLLNKIVCLCVNLNQSSEAAETLNYEYKFEDNPLFLELSRTPANLDGSKMQYSCLVYDLSRFFDITIRQTKEKYQLSDREYEILIRILHGKKHEEIASELYLSVPTVKKYVATIYSKLDITNQKQIFNKLNLFNDI